MPTDLVKFIELLYAVVIGFAFGEISKSNTFKDLISGIFRLRDLINNFSLLFALLIFIISDYTVYMWATDNGGGLPAHPFYNSNFGAGMFILDILLLSIIYFLTTIACLEVSPRRLNSFLLLFVFFHLLVTVWWVLDGIRSGKGALSSIPTPHIIRAFIYLTILMVYRFLIWKNIGGLKKGFKNDSLKYVNPNVFTIAIFLISTIIGSVSFQRFIDFHQRMFSK